MRRLALILPLFLIASGAAAQPGSSTLQMDADHAQVIATVAGAAGRFGIVAGALEYDAARPEASTLLLSFDTSSIENDAVRGAFDAGHYPELRISSTAAAKHGALPVAVTMKDVTRPVIFQVSYKTTAKNVISLHAEGLLKGSDFHFSGNIPVVIDAPFDKVDPTQPLP